MKRIKTILLFICSALLLTGCGGAKKAYESGMEAWEKGDYQAASEYFEAAVTKNGERAEYYIAYGMALNELGQYQSALKQFKAAYQDTHNSIANENNKQILFGEGLAYYHLMDYEKSLECLDSALELKEPESLDSNILSSKGVVLEASGDTEEALICYEQALKKDKKDWDTYLKRADLEAASAATEAAVSDYQKVIKSGDDSSVYKAYFKLYEFYKAGKMTQEADEILQAVIEKGGKEAYHLGQIGWAYHCQGDDDTAQTYLVKSFDAGYSDAGYYLGMLNMQSGEYDQARQYFENYLVLGGGEMKAMAYNQLAGCLVELGEPQEALEALASGIEIASSDSRRVLWKNKVILSEQLGDYNQAEQTAKEYLESYPKDKKMKKELQFIQSHLGMITKKTATGKNAVSETAAPDSTDDSSGDTDADGGASSPETKATPEATYSYDEAGSTLAPETTEQGGVGYGGTDSVIPSPGYTPDTIESENDVNDTDTTISEEQVN